MVSKQGGARPDRKNTGNRPYNTINKHFVEIPPKPIYIGILVFLISKNYVFWRHFSIFFGELWAIFGYILLKTLVLHTFWTIVTFR